MAKSVERGKKQSHLRLWAGIFRGKVQCVLQSLFWSCFPGQVRCLQDRETEQLTYSLVLLSWAASASAIMTIGCEKDWVEKQDIGVLFATENVRVLAERCAQLEMLEMRVDGRMDKVGERERGSSKSNRVT